MTANRAPAGRRGRSLTTRSAELSGHWPPSSIGRGWARPALIRQEADDREGLLMADWVRSAEAEADVRNESPR